MALADLHDLPSSRGVAADHPARLGSPSQVQKLHRRGPPTPACSHIQHPDRPSGELIDRNDHSSGRRIVGDLELVSPVAIQVACAKDSATGELAYVVLLQTRENVPVE